MADPTQQNRQAIGDMIAGILPNSPISGSLGPEARAKAELQAQNEAELAAIQAQGGQASIPFQGAPSQPVPAPMPVQGAPVSTPIDRSQLIPKQSEPVQQMTQVAAPGIDITKYQNAIQNAANAGRTAADEEIVYAENYQKKLDEQNLIDEERRKELQLTIDDKIGQAQSKLDAIAKGEIDPKRLFKDAGPWEKFGTIVLAGLAGPNGYQIIENRIKQDIAAQEKDLDSKYTAESKKLSYLQELRDLYKDDRTAREALRASMYQAAQMKLQGLAARTKNADAQAKASQQIAELEISKQEALAKIGKDAATNFTVSEAESLLPQQFKDRAPDALQEKAVVLPNGKIGLAFDKAGAKIIREQATAATQTISALDRLQDYLKNGNKLKPDQRGAVEIELKSLVGPLKAATVGSGALSEQERAFVLDMLGNPNKLMTLSSVEKAKLITLKNKVMKDFDAQAKTYGITTTSYGSDLTSGKKN